MDEKWYWSYFFYYYFLSFPISFRCHWCRGPVSYLRHMCVTRPRRVTLWHFTQEPGAGGDGWVVVVVGGDAGGLIRLKKRVISPFPHLGVGSMWKWIYRLRAIPPPLPPWTTTTARPTHWFHLLGVIRPASSRVKSNYLTAWRPRLFSFSFLCAFITHPLDLIAALGPLACAGLFAESTAHGVVQEIPFPIFTFRNICV